ncbi:MAG: hypothetical protein LBR78_00710 [Holosporales bacterium]|nr:hypothetical protein [Holosporales bacterium]
MATDCAAFSLGGALSGALNSAKNKVAEVKKTVSAGVKAVAGPNPLGKAAGILGSGASIVGGTVAKVAPSAGKVADALKGGASAAVGTIGAAVKSPTAAKLAGAAVSGLKTVAEIAQPVVAQTLNVVGEAGKEAIKGAIGVAGQAAGAAAAQAIGALGQKAEQTILGTGGAAAGQATPEEIAVSEDVAALNTVLQDFDIDLLRLSRYVDLTERTLNDNHMIALAEWIGALETSGVTGITLNLRGNQITAQGLATLMTALQQHPDVVHILGFAGNPIGDEGAMLIADMVGRLPLRAVVLDSSGITGVGAQAVMASIATAGSGILRYVSMEGNDIQQDDAQTMTLVAALQDGIVHDGIHI